MNRTKRLWSVFMAVVLTAFLMPLASFGTASAEETETGEKYYTIGGYNGRGIVKQPDGENIQAWAFCMDYKQSTPSGNDYTRVRLSELQSYTKNRGDEKTITDNVRRRLYYLADDNYWNRIREFMAYMDFTDVKQYLSENYPSFSEDNFDNAKGHAFARQTLVWTCIHDDSEWETFVKDSNVNGHSDIYKWWEKSYAYYSDDPINDPYSMWNVFYKPVIDYMDTQFRDPFSEGRDAWVYIATDDSKQNILCDVFQVVDKGFVRITKRDGEDKLRAGATLQVIDDTNTVVEEWRSTFDDHYLVEDLDVDRIYTLHEKEPPAGYLPAEDTQFCIAVDGKIDQVLTTTKTTKYGGITKLIVNNYQTEVSVSKVDIADGSEIAGAHIQILDENEDVFTEWDSTTEPYVVKGLTVGETYTLRETVAPDGYLLTSDTTFSIDEDGEVTATANTTEDGVLLVEDTKTSVSISKTDITGSEELAGAHIQILDENEDVFEEWDSTTSAHTVEGLKTGVTYTLRETVAPDGYTIASDTTFSIGTDGTVTADTIENDTILIKDTKTSVRISKVDIADSEELEGAHIQILDEDEKVVEEWDSTRSVHIVEGLKTGVTYTLRETVAPDGYTIASDTTFTIAADGTVTTTANTTTDDENNEVLLVEDSKTKIKVSKVDATNSEEIEGATIQILDEDENIFTEWVSGTEPHEVEGLTAGKTYTLRETVAPDGYSITTDSTFTVNTDGTVSSTNTVNADGVILIADGKNSVSVKKTDVAGEEIEGAKIQILDESGNTVEEWTSTKEAHTVTGLISGVTYTLHEETAPAGYTVAADTEFSFDTNGNVKVKGTTVTDNLILIEDSLTEVKISKTDIADGKELEGAHIQIIDEDEKVVEEWDSTKEAHTVTGLTTDKTYTLRETVAPDGYTIASDTTFTIDKNGKVTSTGTVTSDGVVLVEDTMTSVKVSKVDIADGKELEGAHIQIIDENSIAVAEWTSTKTPHTVKGLTTGKTYTLRETVAPEGYTVASDTTFTIDKNGKVTSTGTVTSDGVILIEDDKTSVKVDKVDGDSKDKLSGAEFILCDGNGSVIKSWVSDGNVFEVNGLKPGDYVIKELIAPKGYKIAENVKFTIDEKGQIVTDVEVENGAILVKDYVVNINTEENEHHADVPGTYPGPDITIVRTDKDTPAPALVVSIYPDGSTKDPASGRHTDDGIVREDVANDESLEEVDSGAAVTESGDVRTETGIFAIAAVMAIAFAVGVLTRKRAK